MVHDGIEPYLEEGLKAVETPAVAGGMVHDIVAPNLETQVVAIRALEWPAGDRQEIEALLAAIEAAAKRGREDPVELVVRDRRAMAAARRRAQAYGLSDCGKLWIALPGPEEDAAQGKESKAEFIEHADSLCRRANAIVLAGLLPYVERGPKAIRRPPVAAKMVDDVVALELEAQGGAIRGLDWPADDGKEIEAVLDALEEVGDRGRKDPAGLIFHNRRAFATARRLAVDYGFSYCGKMWFVLPSANSLAHLH